MKLHNDLLVFLYRLGKYLKYKYNLASKDLFITFFPVFFLVPVHCIGNIKISKKVTQKWNMIYQKFSLNLNSIINIIIILRVAWLILKFEKHRIHISIFYLFFFVLVRHSLGIIVIPH